MVDHGDFEHWGVVVRPEETVNCDPGQIYCHISQIALHADKGNEDVRVFVKVAGQEILLSTLSVDRYPQHTTDLVFDKEFELLHTSKCCNISVMVYKFSWLEKISDASTEGDDDSDDEVPLAIPLYSNADDGKRKETKSGEGKAAGQGSSVNQSPKPKATLEETETPGKLKDDVSVNQSPKPKATLEETETPGKLKDDVGSNDEDDSEEDKSEDNGKAKDQNRPTETPLKTSSDYKNGSVTAKRSAHVHVATPYPSKKVKKSTFNRQ